MKEKRGVAICACYGMLWRIRRLRDERVAAAIAIVVATRKSGKSTDAGNSGMTFTDPSFICNPFVESMYQLAFVILSRR